MLINKLISFEIEAGIDCEMIEEYLYNFKKESSDRLREFGLPIARVLIPKMAKKDGFFAWAESCLVIPSVQESLVLDRYEGPTEMPRVGSMKRIPDGTYTMSGGSLYEVSGLFFSVYSVTNGEFMRAVRDGLYQKREWWSRAGWVLLKVSGWTAPAFWGSEDFNGRNHPVVGVSYYEADAYARWAKMSIPSSYEFKVVSCPGSRIGGMNCKDSQGRGIGKTVAVNDPGYNSSEFGLFHLGGNVWEWTDQKIGSAGVGVIFGGCFIDKGDIDINQLKRSGRETRANYIGFRLVRNVDRREL
ncbi:MAG: SUMF1/EgtB/PvdO family nonheme iron enzyme [Candidatus Saganbacteria bacterium]|nr:SUMF1/EgtB/PvdO family nonheme iron enzyme [Candidatus Saganbacteria bacterium]